MSSKRKTGGADMFRLLRAVNGDNECKKFNVSAVEEDIHKWKVFMPSVCFLDDYIELFNELEKYEHISSQPAGVTFEISFPMEFPSEPPFVRVISPRFCYRTGHITVGGSVCSELLTSEKWNSSIDMSQVLLFLHSTLIEGKAKIDWSKPSIPYSETEARANFLRTAHDHKWKVSTSSITRASF